MPGMPGAHTEIGRLVMHLRGVLFWKEIECVDVFPVAAVEWDEIV